MVNTINSQPDLDFARKWWNKARQSSGTILTKPVLRRKLEQKIKDLETGKVRLLQTKTQALREKKKKIQTNLQGTLLSLSDLQTENKQLTQQLAQTSQDYQETYEKLTESKDQIKDLEQELAETELAKQNQQEEITNLSTNLIESVKKVKQLEEEIKQELLTKWQQDQQESGEENKELKQGQQDQLRKINLLFDDNAANHEVIDFNDLYSLLQQIAERERERERERR